MNKLIIIGAIGVGAIAVYYLMSKSTVVAPNEGLSNIPAPSTVNALLQDAKDNLVKTDAVIAVQPIIIHKEAEQVIVSERSVRPAYVQPTYVQPTYVKPAYVPVTRSLPTMAF